MTLRLGGQKLENFFFLFSTHGARFTWVPGVLFFYFVQLVWESWFDGDKRWNGSLGRIRASQGFFPSDTEVNVAQSAPNFSLPSTSLEETRFSPPRVAFTSLQTFLPRKNYPSFNLPVHRSLDYTFELPLLNSSVISWVDPIITLNSFSILWLEGWNLYFHSYLEFRRCWNL